MLDTMLNVVAFVFVGVLLWLYLAVPMKDDEDE